MGLYYLDQVTATIAIYYYQGHQVIKYLSQATLGFGLHINITDWPN